MIWSADSLIGEFGAVTSDPARGAGDGHVAHLLRRSVPLEQGSWTEPGYVARASATPEERWRQ